MGLLPSVSGESTCINSALAAFTLRFYPELQPCSLDLKSEVYISLLGLPGDIRNTASDTQENSELPFGWQPGECQGPRDLNHPLDQTLV